MDSPDGAVRAEDYNPLSEAARRVGVTIGTPRWAREKAMADLVRSRELMDSGNYRTVRVLAKGWPPSNADRIARSELTGEEPKLRFAPQTVRDVRKAFLERKQYPARSYRRMTVEDIARRWGMSVSTVEAIGYGSRQEAA